MNIEDLKKFINYDGLDRERRLSECEYHQGMVCGKTCRCVEHAEILAGGPVKNCQCLRPPDHSPETKKNDLRRTR